MKTTARCHAVRLLERTLTQKSYSNLLLDKTLSKAELSSEDKRLCAQLYYGVIERLLTLDHILRQYSKKPPEKLDLSVRCILYTGLYQILYCEKIPDRAAVNESVLLTRQMRRSSASGFVNAVLRNFIRDGKIILVPEDPLDAMEVAYSAPRALIQRLLDERDRAYTERFLADSLCVPPTTIRLNPLRGTQEDLEQAGLHPRDAGLANAFFVDSPDVRHVSAFRQGLFHVQDLSSQLCCMALHPRPGDTVLDMCAAPGGKSFTLAEYMENTGKLLAFDLHPHRVELIRKGAERLGLTCIEPRVQDAAVSNGELPMADRVLCDVPCSGFGVIRRKPEIKYRSLEDVTLPPLQAAILANAAGYVKPGGTLVYSTCTVLRSENETVVEGFLSAHPDFVLDPLTDLGIREGMVLLPGGQENCDGFFIARMRRRDDGFGKA